jgi:hypothetical protein
MSLIHYSEPDVRKLLSRVIPARWPHEGLLFLTGCWAEGAGNEGAVEGGERANWRHYEHLSTDRRGFLAATQSRLIYQDRTTPGSIITGLSVVIAAAAVAILVFGNDLMGWLVMATIAFLVWMVSRIVEGVTAATVDLEFDRVLQVEDGTQRMVAVGRRDTLLTLHIDDPSDFRMVAALVSGLGNTPPD